MAEPDSISPALKRRTADGTEVPYSGASGTMQQRAESPQPTFWDCTHRSTYWLGLIGPIGPAHGVRHPELKRVPSASRGSQGKASPW